MSTHSPGPWRPAPLWRWRERDLTSTGKNVPVLEDAGGVILLIASGGVICSPGRGPYLRRLSEAAPELAGLLHEMIGPDHCSCRLPCEYERARALLRRIEEGSAP